MNNMLRAIRYATMAHANQVRKYSGIPYITHPISVATILQDHFIKDKETLIGAILHDTIEDTYVTYEDILWHFGRGVAEIVKYCTHEDNPNMNRYDRKQASLKIYVQGCKKSQNIKMADMIHNCTSIIKEDPKFANVYMREKFRLAKALTKADDNLVDTFLQLYLDWIWHSGGLQDE